MKRKLLVLGLSLMFVAGNALHAEETDETRLKTEEQSIDKDKTASMDAQKEAVLAKQYHVSAAAIQDLRAKGQGWGEIIIGLATARQLKKTEPKTYPTLSDALAKVEFLRASGEGWGKIAKSLGFKLGPVVSAAHHTRHELHRSLHEERAEHHHHEAMETRVSMRPETPTPEHPERPVRPGH